MTERTVRGAALKEVRTNLGLTQKELAEKTGYSQGYISLAEQGKVTPKAKFDDALAKLVESNTTKE